MNILGKPGISLGSITYRRNYRTCCSHQLFFLALQVVRSRSGLEVYREADWKSIPFYYCFPDNIFDNSRVKTLKLSSFLLWDLPLLATDSFSRNVRLESIEISILISECLLVFLISLSLYYCFKVKFFSVLFALDYTLINTVT